MKITLITCDRCGCHLDMANWQAHDDLCNDCVLLVEGAAVVGREAMLKNKKPLEYLKEWLELYNDD